MQKEISCSAQLDEERPSEWHESRDGRIGILIIAHFVRLKRECGNSRFTYLAELLAKNDQCDVEIVTSSFLHSTKKQRNIDTDRYVESGYQVSFIREPGYEKNVSVKRIYSHTVIGKNLRQYLNQRNKPDVIYCSVPSLSLAKVAVEYARKNHIRFIIDIQDLWPEAFKVIFHTPFISDLIYFPMLQTANQIYSAADEIVAVSETYASRAMQGNRKCRESHSVFLGTDLGVFDGIKKKQQKKNDEIWIAYIGTLGHSYDLLCVIDTINLLNNRKKLQKCKLLVMGDGPLKEKFEKYAKDKNICCRFTGRLPYQEMVDLLSQCHIAVNPIVKNAAASIINKVGDYAAAGLPIVNTQECQELRKLIEHYHCGFNCINGNAWDVAEKIERLCMDEQLRMIMGKNSRRLAEEKFDRRKTYATITELIMRQPLLKKE